MDHSRYHIEGVYISAKCNLQAGLEVSLQPPLNGGHVLLGSHPGLTLLAATGQSQVLGHDALLVDDVNAGTLQLLGEGDNVGGLIERAALHQTAGPGEDRRNGVG